jgi:hypothetical protein
LASPAGLEHGRREHDLLAARGFEPRPSIERFVAQVRVIVVFEVEAPEHAARTVGRALQGSWAERIEAQCIDAGSQQGFQSGATHKAQPNYGHIARLHDKTSMLLSEPDRLRMKVASSISDRQIKLGLVAGLGQQRREGDP